MFRVRIKETGEEKELSIIDRNSGVDWVSDLIGNAGATIDGQFTWDNDEEVYHADRETYDWWARYIEDTEKTEDEIEALAEELDISTGDIRAALEGAYAYRDYEDHRAAAIEALAELREKAQGAAELAEVMGATGLRHQGDGNTYMYIDTRTDNPYQIAGDLIAGAGYDETMRGDMTNEEVAEMIASYYQQENARLVDFDGEVMSISDYVLRYLEEEE